MAFQRSLNEFSEKKDFLNTTVEQSTYSSIAISGGEGGERKSGIAVAPNIMDARQAILSDYSNKYKAQMQTQFRNSFSSAGSIQSKYSLPTISFVNTPGKIIFSIFN